MADFIYLASKSPRRRQLLDQIGVKHELLLPAKGEDAESLEAERPGELPLAYVKRVTAAKLKAARVRHAARRLPDAPILCADTTVALGRSILGKPVSSGDARRILSMLSGRTHRVITAVSVFANGKTLHAVNISRVRFAEIDTNEIDAYVKTRQPHGKAGAYAIQSAAASWIEQIEGSYSSIMGLPLFETAQLLKRARHTF